MASQSLQRCAWGQESNLATILLTTFRTKKVLEEIITKSKTILATDEGFFTEPNALPRWTGGKNATDADAGVVSFVEEQIESAEGDILSLGDCLNQFESVSTTTLSRKETSQKINDAIRELHGVGLRNDLILKGRQVKGWNGLKLRPRLSPMNLADGEVRDSGRSVQSVGVEKGRDEALLS